MEQRAHCTRCFFCQKWTPCWSSRSRIIGLRDVVQLMRYKPKSIAAKPMRLTLPVSCAKPASGHDAAPPSSVMKRVKTVRSGKRSLGSVLREAFSGKRSPGSVRRLPRSPATPFPSKAWPTGVRMKRCVACRRRGGPSAPSAAREASGSAMTGRAAHSTLEPSRI